MPESVAEFTNGEIAAVEREQSAAASPAPHAQPEVQSASQVATQPATSADPVADPHGPIPFERHEAILSKARRESDEALSRLRWAERYDPQAVQRALEIADLYERRDPRLLERFQPASAEPQPDAVDEQRQPYYTPRQAAKWAAWQAQQIVNEKMAEIDARLGPIESDRESFERQQQHLAAIDEAQTWPAFNDHVDEITKMILQNNEDRRRDPRIARVDLREAYIRVVVPKLASSREHIEAEGKKKWLAELNNTTRSAQTELNPHRTDHSQPRKKFTEMSFDEAIPAVLAELKARTA